MNNLYTKLAWTNIKNNRQFYLPYLLTGILSAAMFYIITAMQRNSGISEMRGSGSLRPTLTLGTYVIGIFVCIFLFYTNSFIIKRRKKELGIYNILGMEKRHIAKELAAETFFAAGISIAGGLLVGIVFNKFMIMLLYQISGLSTPIQFEISTEAVIRTIELFGLIYAATLIYDMMQVRLSKPIELLHGGNVGEREPKTKMLMTLTGILCIGIGYFIAITTQSPLEALMKFFVAVILVIIGTYSLFTAGSIALLKALRKNKPFYYKTNHFIAVSGMIYRMKQNAVGLANICILSTMVLVMVSTTVCLYIGADDELKDRYPTEITIRKISTDYSEHTELEKEIENVIHQNGRTITSKYSYTSLQTSAYYREQEHLMDLSGDHADYQDISLLYIMTKADYEQEHDVTLKALSDGEIAVIGNPAYTAKELTLLNRTFPVKYAQSFDDSTDQYYMADVIGGMFYIILPDKTALEELYAWQQEQLGKDALQYTYDLRIDINGSREEIMACDKAIISRLTELSKHDDFMDGLLKEFRELNRADFYVMNGGFLFLGIFLGTMFLMVTVLIIFYKQISEGYADRERYEIMEKVGMSNKEVRAAIGTQVRLVFILPIITAAIHVTAAFPMIQRLLRLMNLFNWKLFAVCLAGTILVFSLIYLIVFLLTSRSYYKIVRSR